MFVWSQNQARQLLGAEQNEESNIGAEWKNEKTNDELDGGKDAGPRNQESGVPFEEGRSLDPDEVERISPRPPSHWVGDRLLDLGAGDGHVTQVLASGAKYVDVTEASPVMRRRLRDLGYRVLDTWKWMDETEGIQYDVITALNLLDRCDTPKTLLRDIHRKLTDNGYLVIALVLPFCPYVEVGSADNLPSENLGISGSTTEEQVNSLASEVLPNLGFKLVKWTKLPYLCEGDLDQAFYWLSDVLLVLQKTENSLLDKNLYDKFTDNGLLNVKAEL
ncbi:protein-L-histidine N-pros-methyltransferase-like [Palaemon carinicauda]|uniref:protein-L-histidine N-pros-methyltransferase-like n=1 Tax=Palaemon carinicauda TaxID=392227 RepID=UPI0035B5F76F